MLEDQTVRLVCEGDQRKPQRYGDALFSATRITTNMCICSWRVLCVRAVSPQTNGYFNFCTSNEPNSRRTKRHEAKKGCKGKTFWPAKGITKSMMMGVIGIVLAIGLVQLPELADHWCTTEFHNFKLIRDCMPRDMFGIIYCRFFHMADAGASLRLKDGSIESGWDALHHIR